VDDRSEPRRRVLLQACTDRKPADRGVCPVECAKPLPWFFGLDCTTWLTTSIAHCLCDPSQEVFRQIPLDFVGQQTLRWGGVNGTSISFNATYVTEGTTPPGSMWSVNPIPRNDDGQTGKGFPPHCDTTKYNCEGMTDGCVVPPCSSVYIDACVPALMLPETVLLTRTCAWVHTAARRLIPRWKFSTT
jgi:hypothetical protein